jgi:adenylylsulfate kinase
VGLLSAGGVLITGVYGSGKSSVAAEISYLLERRRQPHALLDLDYLGWGGDNFDDHAAGFGLMLRNLAAVASNYRDAGISVFIVAYFIRSHDALRAVRDATGVPLRVVRLSVPLPEIEQRLAADMTSGRRDDLREAASSIAAGEGVGVEDVTVVNDQPVPLIAHEVMTWLGWE